MLGRWGAFPASFFLKKLGKSLAIPNILCKFAAD
jgi:hypothetical protein